MKSNSIHIFQVINKKKHFRRWRAFLKGIVMLLFTVSKPHGGKKDFFELQSHNLSKNHKLSDNRMKLYILLSFTIRIFPIGKMFAITCILLFYMEQKDHLHLCAGKKKMFKIYRPEK